MTGRAAVSLFDHTGNAVAPWRDAGYDCWIIDIQHPTGEHRRDDGVMVVGADMRRWRMPRYLNPAIVLAWPPCTHLAVSGARWFKGKGLFALAESIELFGHAAESCEASGAPYLIENPVSTISTYWREPDYRFNPCDFALYNSDPGEDAYTKETCLWTGGGFRMPDIMGVEPVQGSKMHLIPPGPDRANIRSATPRGFAQAIFHANTPTPRVRAGEGDSNNSPSGAER